MRNLVIREQPPLLVQALDQMLQRRHSKSNHVICPIDNSLLRLDPC